MADWITIPDFADGQVGRAKTFQDMWANLYTLKNRPSAIQEMPGSQSLGDRWATTTTLSFLDIDATYWQLPFTSYGGDVLIRADLITFHSVTNGTSYWRFFLDGVALGNTLGLAGNRDSKQLDESINLHYVAQNLAAGNHTLSTQFYNGTAGSLYVEKYACMSFWTYEFA